MKKFLGKLLNLLMTPLYILVGLSFVASMHVKALADKLSKGE